MTVNSNPIVLALVGALLALGVPATAAAAKAPLDPEELKEEATHIVSGIVLEVTSKVGKSKLEKSFGIHRDRVYTIRLKVAKVVKGSGIKAEEIIHIVAWKPSKRVPPVVGLQGHEPIPEKGDSVTAYLSGKDGDAYKPLLPNGIAIGTDAD